MGAFSPFLTDISGPVWTDARTEGIYGCGSLCSVRVSMWAWVEVSPPSNQSSVCGCSWARGRDAALACLSMTRRYFFYREATNSLCVCVWLYCRGSCTHTHLSKNIISCVIMLVVMRLLITKHSAAFASSRQRKRKSSPSSPPPPVPPLPPKLERQTSGRENDDKHFHKRSNFLPPPALTGSIRFTSFAGLFTRLCICLTLTL